VSVQADTSFDCFARQSQNAGPNVTEPDVALTDYALAVESGILAALLLGEPSARPDLQRWFVVFFGAIGTAATLGGTVHGFFAPRRSPLGTVLWRGALMAIGLAAGSAWLLGAALLWGHAPDSTFLGIVAAGFVAYAVVVLAVTDAFWVAVASYLPPTGFLMFAYWNAFRSDPAGAFAIGFAGLALTMAAGLAQQLRIGIHPIYFNHNAVYHAVQAAALLMIFWSAQYLVYR
jgi:hypothetical protein